MNLFLEGVITNLKVLYYILESIVLLFVPFSLRRKNVKGEKVLITGAGSGLGRLMSQRFAQLGCTLVLVDVNQSANEETASMLREYGVSTHAYTCDLSKREDVYRVMNKVKEEVGDIDILINNAGIVTGYKILQCPDELMQKTMDVNVTAHFWTVKSVLPSMLSRNHGHIVSIASGAGLFGVSGVVDYCASKFGAVGFDEALRSEIASLGKTGVHTTVICPYFIQTGMFAGIVTRFPSMLPFMEPEYVVGRILDGVLCNQPIVLIPRVLYIFLALRNLLPVKALTVANDFFGLNKSMEDFKGRRKDD